MCEQIDLIGVKNMLPSKVVEWMHEDIDNKIWYQNAASA